MKGKSLSVHRCSGARRRGARPVRIAQPGRLPHGSKSPQVHRRRRLAEDAAAERGRIRHAARSISTSTGKPKPWSPAKSPAPASTRRTTSSSSRAATRQLARDAQGRAGAAGDRVRSRRQRRQRLGRPQRAAQRHPRLLRRLPGQHLDRRQRRRHRAEVLARRRRCCCRSARAACATTRRQHLRQLGRRIPLANQSKTLLNQPANMWVDPDPDPVTGQRGSIYIADGYGNHRVVVFSATGTWLRQWGGVAGTVNDPMTDSPGLFASGDGGHPHCVVGGNDGADLRLRPRRRPHPGLHQDRGPAAHHPGRSGNRRDARHRRRARTRYGRFGLGPRVLQRREADVHVRGRRRQRDRAHHGPRDGHDPRRVRSAGAAGRPVHVPAHSKDSKGNLYTGETINGRRVQKFVPSSATTTTARATATATATDAS